MYIDASALVAIALGESDRDELAARLEAAPERTTSVISLFEAMIAIGREMGDRSMGFPVVQELVERAEIEVSDIRYDLLGGLSDAFQRYGKGSGHPARLNLGDCFSYAAAKQAGVPLLYKGNDFAHTDLA